MLTKNNLKKYLIEKKLISPKENIIIEGGLGALVNSVFRVQCENRSFILKQFSDKAKFDKNLWLGSNRFFYEKSAIEYLNTILKQKITPDIVFYDEDNKVICMKDLGQRFRLDNLMQANKANPQTFSKIGKLVAEIHTKSFCNQSLLALFDNKHFQEKRIFYRYYSQIKDKSLIKPRDELISDCRKNRIALLHNDLRFPNIFVLNKTQVRFVDYEGAYYGDPAFETGCFLGHLFLYYLNQPSQKNMLAITNFWNSYIKCVTFKFKQKLEENAVRHIGFVIIYKLFGVAKEDAEFVKDKGRLASIAKKIILNKEIKKVENIFSLSKQR